MRGRLAGAAAAVAANLRIVSRRRRMISRGSALQFDKPSLKQLIIFMRLFIEISRETAVSDESFLINCSFCRHVGNLCDFIGQPLKQNSYL